MRYAYTNLIAFVFKVAHEVESDELKSYSEAAKSDRS